MKNQFLILLLLFIAGSFYSNEAQAQFGVSYGRRPYPYRRPAPTKRDSADMLTKKDKLVYGFNLGSGPNISSTFISIDISPWIGYRATKALTVAGGLSYQYYNIGYLLNTDNNIHHYETAIYGGRVFAQYTFLRSFFGQAEYEILNVPRRLINGDFTNSLGNSGGHTIIENPLIGVGYRSEIGERSYTVLTLLYAIDYNNGGSGNIYNSPLILRFGFQF